MIQNWRVIPLNKYSGSLNMAIDEILLESVIKGTSSDVLRFYQWKNPTASIGSHQSLSAEINLEYTKCNNIDIVRRISGGGAVLHDSNYEITYSTIINLSNIPKNYLPKREYDKRIPKRYHLILDSIALGLESLGIPIDLGKIHCPALMLNGKKISGNAQVIKDNVLLQHGTILLKVDPKFMYKVLKAPTNISYTKMVRSVRSKVIGIYQNENDITIKDSDRKKILINAIIEGFEKLFNIHFLQEILSPEELLKAKDLAKKKYQQDKWLKKYP